MSVYVAANGRWRPTITKYYFNDRCRINLTTWLVIVASKFACIVADAAADIGVVFGTPGSPETVPYIIRFDD